MSGHGGLPVIKTAEKHMPNQTFWFWLKHETALYISQLLTFLSIALYIGTFGYYVFGNKKGLFDEPFTDFLSKAQILLFSLNIGACILFIYVLISIIDKNDTGIHQVKEAFKQIFGKSAKLDDSIINRGRNKLRAFKINLIHYWIYAIIFYIFQIVTKMFKIEEIPWVNYVNLILNTYGAFVIYLCFRLLILSNEQNYPKGVPLPLWLRWRAGRLAIIIISILYAGCYFAVREFLWEERFVMTLLESTSGVINMIAISMLVARMDSKLIGIASGLISIIYGYAVIQSLSPLFSQHPVISSTSYLLVFVFKIYFFIIVIYALQTGRMLNFFCCTTELAIRVKKARQGFFKGI